MPTDPNAGSFTPINMFAMIRDLINNGCPIVTNAGAPTSGTSGTFVGQAGPGALLIDFTNGVLYINTGTLASPTWTKIYSATAQIPITALTTNGALPITTSAVFAVTKSGVLTDTVAAPPSSANGGDGIEITIISDTANAHVFTFTGNILDSGSAAVGTATFNASKGASLTIMSYNARWKVISANGVSFT